MSLVIQGKIGGLSDEYFFVVRGNIFVIFQREGLREELQISGIHEKLYNSKYVAVSAKANKRKLRSENFRGLIWI